MSRYNNYNNTMEDPITPHSSRLISYMNGHPQTLLGYAKYYGDSRTAMYAKMIDIDSSGIVLDVTMEDGQQEEIHVKFKTPLRGYEEVRPVLEEMAKEAETALGLPSTRPPSTTTPYDPSQHTPYVLPSLTPLLVGLSLILFVLCLDLFPEYLPSSIAPLREALGPGLCRAITYFTFTVRSVETIFITNVLRERGEPDPVTFAMWIVSSLLFGYFSSYRLFEERKDKANKTE